MPVEGRKRSNLARLIGATALACLLAAADQCRLPALATRTSARRAEVPAGSQMLLEADTLIYDNDNNTVTAAGSVQIDYGGNKLVAQRSSTTARPGGWSPAAMSRSSTAPAPSSIRDDIDITDDFADGFVNALRVETVDKAYFAAESAERKGGI